MPKDHRDDDSRERVRDLREACVRRRHRLHKDVSRDRDGVHRLREDVKVQKDVRWNHRAPLQRGCAYRLKDGNDRKNRHGIRRGDVRQNLKCHRACLQEHRRTDGSARHCHLKGGCAKRCLLKDGSWSRCCGCRLTDDSWSRCDRRRTGDGSATWSCRLDGLARWRLTLNGCCLLSHRNVRNCGNLRGCRSIRCCANRNGYEKWTSCESRPL